MIKQIVFWSLLVGLGCLFWFQKLQERKQRQPRPLWRRLLHHISPDAFSFFGLAGCRTTGQTQTDDNIAAGTSCETKAYADAPETNTNAAKAPHRCYAQILTECSNGKFYRFQPVECYDALEIREVLVSLHTLRPLTPTTSRERSFYAICPPTSGIVSCRMKSQILRCDPACCLRAAGEIPPLSTDSMHWRGLEAFDVSHQWHSISAPAANNTDATSMLPFCAAK